MKELKARNLMLLVRALIDISGKRPVAVGHWARRVGYDGWSTALDQI